MFKDLTSYRWLWRRMVLFHVFELICPHVHALLSLWCPWRASRMMSSRTVLRLDWFHRTSGHFYVSVSVSVLRIVALAKSGPSGQVLACSAAPDFSHCSLDMYSWCWPSLVHVLNFVFPTYGGTPHGQGILYTPGLLFDGSFTLFFFERIVCRLAPALKATLKPAFRKAFLRLGDTPGIHGSVTVCICSVLSFVSGVGCTQHRDSRVPCVEYHLV